MVDCSLEHERAFKPERSKKNPIRDSTIYPALAGIIALDLFGFYSALWSGTKRETKTEF